MLSRFFVANSYYTDACVRIIINSNYGRNIAPYKYTPDFLTH